MKYEEWVETVDLDDCDDILCVAGLSWDYQQNKIDKAIEALESSKPNMMKLEDAMKALKILKGEE